MILFGIWSTAATVSLLPIFILSSGYVVEVSMYLMFSRKKTLTTYKGVVMISPLSEISEKENKKKETMNF